MPVHAGGKLFIAVYNNQDWVSDFWRNVKRTYCSGRIGKLFIPAIFVPYFVLRGIVADLVIRRRNPLRRYSHYKNNRGMSMVRDWIDWLGGYPFEVAKPEEVFHFYRDRGFILVKLKTCGGGLGCNEFVFERRKNGSR
jgi:2-polyprenyl-6-hydroxyphenyl methylase/3-demethylubiquinone-9 3-methyltransferase